MIVMQYLTIIFRQKQNQAVVAGSIANTPSIMKRFGKELCLLCLITSILKLHALHQCYSNLHRHMWDVRACAEMKQGINDLK